MASSFTTRAVTPTPNRRETAAVQAVNETSGEDWVPSVASGEHCKPLTVCQDTCGTARDGRCDDNGWSVDSPAEWVGVRASGHGTCDYGFDCTECVAARLAPASHPSPHNPT